MNTVGSWVPHLRGQVLNSSFVNPFADCVPSGDDPLEEPWSRPSVMKQLDDKPDSTKDAVYDAVLAVWRLKKCEESGNNGGDWLDLTEAWLVSWLFNLRGCGLR